MGFNSIVKAFLPQDKVFYNLFEQVGGNLVKMSNTFHTAIAEQDHTTRLNLFRQLEEGEHLNDDITHKIFVELGQNFITPFDREDIHYLATSLDDVADFIYASSKKIINYQVLEMDNYMLRMAAIVQEAVSALKKALH